MTRKRAKKGSRNTASASAACESRISFAWRFKNVAFISVFALCVLILFVGRKYFPQEYRHEIQISDSQITFPTHGSTPLDASQALEHVATDSPQDLDVVRIEEEIRASLNVLTEAFPEDYLALHLAGIVYARFKQTAFAETRLRRSLAIAKHDIQVREDLAELLMQTGSDAAAVQVLIEDLGHGTASQNYIELLAESQERMGQLEEARNTLLAGRKQFPNSAKIWLRLGSLQLQLNEYTEAESSVRRALAIEPASEPAQLVLSQSLALQNRTAEAAEVRLALNALRESNQLHRKSFEETYKLSFQRFACSTFRSMANIYQRHHEPSTAMKWLDRAIEIDPADVPTLALLASHHRNARDFQQAVKVCQRIIQLQPEILSNYTNMANLNMELGNVPGALEALQLAAQRNLGQGRAHLQLAQFYLLLERAPDAVQEARRAVQEIESIDAYLVLIAALGAAGQSAQAKAELAKALRIAPLDPRLEELGRR